MFRVVPVDFEVKNLAFSALGIGVGLPKKSGTMTSMSMLDQSPTSSQVNVVPLLLDVLGMRYMVRATDRIGLYVDAGLGALLVLVHDEVQSFGIWTAGAGLRIETIIPIDVYARYYKGTSAIGLGITLYTIGEGRRPYFDRVVGDSVW